MDHGFDTARLAGLLEGLGRSFGLPGLKADDKGGCLLMFDDALVTLQQDPAGQHLTMHTEVGRLAADASKERLEALLAANLFWARTGGATLALLPANRALLLARRLELERLSLADFEASLGEFLKAADAWREQLALPEPREGASWEAAAAMAGVRA